MSGRMDFRRTPDSKEWLGSFKGSIRDAIDNYCNDRATAEDLGFFRGMVVTSSEDDREPLETIVGILENGGTVDFKIEY